MRLLYAVVLVVLGASANSAEAATFRALAEGNTVKIFSQSTEEKVCTVWVHFSYLYEGERHQTFTTCPDRKIFISEDAEVCEVTNAQIVDPKLEGPVEYECEE